jgi:hypothetical protein
VAFLLVQNKFLDGEWRDNWLDFGVGVTVILEGVPFLQVYGLALGMFYLKVLIYRRERIWYKYAKDGGAMKEVSSMLFEKREHSTKIKLKMWWNGTEEMIEEKGEGQMNERFESMFVNSLRCADF